jgi:hypothetical protein
MLVDETTNDTWQRQTIAITITITITIRIDLSREFQFLSWHWHGLDFDLSWQYRCGWVRSRSISTISMRFKSSSWWIFWFGDSELGSWDTVRVATLDWSPTQCNANWCRRETNKDPAVSGGISLIARSLFQIRIGPQIKPTRTVQELSVYCISLWFCLCHWFMITPEYSTRLDLTWLDSTRLESTRLDYW